ncbi:beta strand repeat-containing protein [Haloferula sp.]|uniref:beta strand repeat-containing protein n=1 Tax=Haloferula sp. TaxID=2497595 RepID=UPI00329E0A78
MFPSTGGTSNWDQTWTGATVASANAPFNLLPAASVPDIVCLSDDQVLVVDSAIDIAAGEVIINDLDSLSATLNINPGGTLTTGLVTLGLGSGEGSLNVQGGTLTSSEVTVTANNPLNTVNVSSGTLATEFVTVQGGDFNVNGGAFTTSAVNALFLTGGNFNLSSGTVTLTDPNPGGDPFNVMGSGSSGTLNVTGGSFIVAGATVAGDNTVFRGTTNISGGSFSALGGNQIPAGSPVFNITGDDATIDLNICSTNSAGRAATYNFKFGSTGISAINCATRTRLSFATVTVDGADYTGGPGTHHLFATGNVGNLVNDAPTSATVITPFPGLDATIELQGNGLVVVLTEPITNPSTWDGETDTDWSVATNWLADVAPVATDTLFFEGIANTTTNNDLAAGTEFNGINFTNSGNGESFTLAGNSIQLSNNITSTAVDTPEVDAIVDTISLDLEILGNDRSIIPGEGHDLEVSGVISEDTSARMITKSGSGTLTFSSANTYTGGTTLGAGRININNDGALGSGTLLVTGGGSVGNTSGGLVTIANAVTIDDRLNFISDYSMIVNGDVVLAANSIIAVTTPETSELTLNGVVSDGGGSFSLSKFGSGSLVLNNSGNSFTGTLSANNGQNLIASSIGMSGVNSAAGAGSQVTIANNGNLIYTGSGDTTDRLLNVGGGGNASLNNSGTGALVFSGGGFSNNATAAKTFTLSGANIDDNEIDGALIDSTQLEAFPLSVTKSGDGKWILSGAHTYTGTTTVNGGILALPATADLSDDSSVQLNSAGTLDLAAALNIKIKSLTVDGGSPLADGTYGSSTSGATNAGLANPDDYFSGDGILTVELGDPYLAWSGGAAFEDDANGDGVSNGLAWILGAADPAANALGLLPVPVQTGGDLSMDFTQINPIAPNKLFVEYSNDLGVLDPWHSVEIPTVSGTVDDIEFTITPGSPSSSVSLSIPASKSAGGKLFSRLSATGN